MTPSRDRDSRWSDCLELIAVGATAAVVFGILYAYFCGWTSGFRNATSFLAKSALRASLFGTLCGLCLFWAANLTAQRRPVVVRLVVFLTSSLGVYVAWAIHGVVQFGWSTNFILWNPIDVLTYIRVYHTAVVTAFGSSTLKIVGLFVLEFLIVLRFTWVLATKGERHRSWLRTFIPGGQFISTELPLLKRELTELANRRRTYFVRGVCAVVILFLIFVAYHRAVMFRRNSLFGLGFGVKQFLGIGGDIFSEVIPLLFYSIQLLMPALCCASISAEKENNTIGTLLLTKISPGTIVLEKLGSRMIPMLTLLLLTFPVLAYVFTLGGVDTEMLVGTLWLLFCECLLIASISLMFSAWFSTTIAAFTWSYVAIGLLVALTASLQVQTYLPSAVWNAAYSGDQRLVRVVGMFAAPAKVVTAEGLALQSIPSLMLTCICLLLTRLVVVRRAFVTSSSAVLRAFRVIDEFFKQLNERTTGGIILIADSNPLPGDNPVAWRERNKKSLGKARYLIRFLVVLELPTLIICMFAAIISARSAFEGLYVLLSLVWIIAALIATVKGATLFSSERAKQTIEPLLASPMSALELVKQKIDGMRRLLFVLAIPILTVNFTFLVLYIDTRSVASFLSSIGLPLSYMFLSTFCVFVLLYLTAWLSAGVGLKIQSQTKAVVAALCFVGGWVAIPFVASAFFRDHTLTRDVIQTFSPISPVVAVERYLYESGRFFRRGGYYSQSTQFSGLAWSAISLVVYAFCLLAISKAVQGLSPRLLCRRENPREYRSTQVPHLQQIKILEGSQT